MQRIRFNAHGMVARWATLFCCVAVLLFATKGSSQIGGTANIQGTVTDTTGAVITNASVTLTNESTQVTRTTKSDNAGVYVFPGIPIGPYDLVVAAPGFKTYEQTRIVLEVGSSITINPTLAVGEVAVKVEVQSVGLALQTEDPAFKQTVDQQDLTEMPLNSVSRQITGLLTITGGANGAPGGDFTGSKYTYQTIAVSIAGGNGNTTRWLLDGGDNEDYMSMGNLPFPFPDAVSQFSVESTVLGAQDGEHSGGVVNVVTRSGTNTYHGSAFEFIRNNYIDATNFYSTSPDTLHQNQYGGTFGGKIIRDKLFAFAAYQHVHATQTTANSEAYIPTADNLKGDFSTTDGSVCAPATGGHQLVDPLTGATLPGNKYPSPPTYNAQALALEKYMPAINPAVDINNCGLVSYDLPYLVNDNAFVTRVDYTINPKNNLYGRYFVDGYQNPAFFSPTNIFLTNETGLIQRTQTFTLGEAYTITPQLVNAAHATIMRRRDDRGTAATGINPNTLGIDVYVEQPTVLYISTAKWGLVGPSVAAFNDNTLNLSDDVTWVRGKHQIVFGGEWVQNELNIANGYESNGHFYFGTAYSAYRPTGTQATGAPQEDGDGNLDFLMGTMSRIEQSKEQQNGLRSPLPSLYAQDTYHASKRLVLVAGVRWSATIMPVDVYNRGSVFNMSDYVSDTYSTVYPNAPPGALFYGDKGVPRAFTANTHWQFSPNVGASFDPVGNGKTVIRAGFELVYDQPNLFTGQRVNQNPPFATAVDNVQLVGTAPVSFSAPWSVGEYTTSPFPQPPVPTPTEAKFYANTSWVVLPPNSTRPIPRSGRSAFSMSLATAGKPSSTTLGTPPTTILSANR